MAAMGRGFEKTYLPRTEFYSRYEEKYRRYSVFGKIIQKEHIL
jgi:hypothetical protein